MYNKKDIENAKIQNKVPDGMSNESDFVNTLQEVANLLRKTEYSTSSGKTVLGLELINLACDEDGNVEINKAINVIIAMSSHISQFINTFNSIESLDINRYFDEYQSTILDPLIEKPVIPYYE